MDPREDMVESMNHKEKGGVSVGPKEEVEGHQTQLCPFLLSSP